MNATWVIFKKEIKTFLYSPLAYIIGFLMMVLWALFFYLGSIMGGYAGIQPMFSFPSFFMLFLTPLMTMKLIADEKKTGTIEFLLTLPIKPKDIVLGKYFAVASIYLLLVVLSLIFTLFIAIKGNPDSGVILSVYIGVILQGLALLSLGFLMSTITDSQVVAAISSLGLGLFLLLISLVADSLSSPWNKILGEFSFIEHLSSFFRGVIDLKDVAFFLLMTVVGLTLSINYLENEKWRK